MKWDEIGKNIAKEIEKEILPYFGRKDKSYVVGTSPSGDETEIFDKISEDIALKYLKSLNVNIVSEELGVIDNSSEWTVVIDPIDGSFNFINGIPFFAFCFGVFKNNEPYYGLTYEFLTKSFYEAYKGKGAYLNGRKIKVKDFNPNNIVISYYPSKKIDLEKLRNKVKRVRIFGAFGLEMCYVAKGTLDAVFDVRPKVRAVDIASSYIICKEAGALITDENGDELKFDLNATDRLNIIVANSKEMLDIILDLL
ncbi:TPA: bifunctional fructose-bisphosphatase/inositol-phosphate phosphatase [Methanocaldococcus jannaschii]|uniref:Fructose-1,6-bisphosphatase/inositol-1-monophosphatase n=2 Tax=Methanocaldococcus jannaschii TaxID=2190 RepID=BSUHB_METJA|nr:bifunctional fructose-bisphosphatase/inositol-phosphate phosphatase [Methanocaldococcus jannaschii]Q57573.1 RecName: Full=Fructose-1,6-bisphosphatase/inositol-1-monophosphatase; Short=FBPase/IMPase; AltName: Full=Inositol-1-phosphatase; Short=I-1-Pase [Methanocaldococcus jannaschii DSM 2661]1DK4_A Chain A, INOSITOL MONOPHOSPHATASE [Methanocaldococcus jannaschii]1DK4_B Chain B, INOSITOL MONOPHOSPHATASE [Methanocaldococcus jannaschii]1G0H_A Chain A, INOSITOL MONOPHOSPHATASE [Methanocaldococcus